MFEPENRILEVNGAPAGILVQDNYEYVFHAAADWAWPLDRSRYTDRRSAKHALLAIAPNRVVPDEHIG